jgi:hypothetical protein
LEQEKFQNFQSKDAARADLAPLFEGAATKKPGV